jgi:hypothetical protein
MNCPQIASGGKASHRVPLDHPHYKAVPSRTLAVAEMMGSSVVDVPLIAALVAFLVLPQM